MNGRVMVMVWDAVTGLPSVIFYILTGDELARILYLTPYRYIAENTRTVHLDDFEFEAETFGE